jgi:hypothetical protein
MSTPEPVPVLDDRWPFDATAVYNEAPDPSLDARILEMQAKGALAAKQIGETVYVDGPCPRCGHHAPFEIPVEVVGPLAVARSVPLTCGCSAAHGRAAGSTGCGLEYEVTY